MYVSSNSNIVSPVSRDESRTAATSKMERFVIIVNGWKPLTIITKCSILDVAAVLVPPLVKPVKPEDSAAQCDICQFWIHIKCNKLNHIDYKYLQGYNNPWHCISAVTKFFHLKH